jgi:hypothetical protein
MFYEKFPQKMNSHNFLKISNTWWSFLKMWDRMKNYSIPYSLFTDGANEMTNLTQTNSLYIPKELDTNLVDNQ